MGDPPQPKGFIHQMVPIIVFIKQNVGIHYYGRIPAHPLRIRRPRQGGYRTAYYHQKTSFITAKIGVLTVGLVQALLLFSCFVRLLHGATASIQGLYFPVHIDRAISDGLIIGHHICKIIHGGMRPKRP